MIVQLNPWFNTLIAISTFFLHVLKKQKEVTLCGRVYFFCFVLQWKKHFLRNMGLGKPKMFCTRQVGWIPFTLCTWWCGVKTNKTSWSFKLRGEDEIGGEAKKQCISLGWIVRVCELWTKFNAISWRFICHQGGFHLSLEATTVKLGCS